MIFFKVMANYLSWDSSREGDGRGCIVFEPKVLFFIVLKAEASLDLSKE